MVLFYVRHILTSSCVDSLGHFDTTCYPHPPLVLGQDKVNIEGTDLLNPFCIVQNSKIQYEVLVNFDQARFVTKREVHKRSSRTPDRFTQSRTELIKSITVVSRVPYSFLPSTQRTL
jgi:hypothetical protein